MGNRSCGHEGLDAGEFGLCTHLVGDADGRPDVYVRRLRGRSVESDYLCLVCAAASDPVLVASCRQCVAELPRWGDVHLAGWAGISSRPTEVSPQLLGTIENSIAGANSVAPFRDGWIHVSHKQALWVHDAAGSREIGSIPALHEERGASDARQVPANHTPRLKLHASRDGAYAAVVRDFGQHGILIETGSGTQIRELDRGAYHEKQTPFPCAFTEHRGAQVLLAGTDWNRVDAFALPSGELLTSRGPTSYKRGEPRPEHYLDYFHGALHVSPDGTRVVDDGWVWHPVGMPLVWDVDRWLNGDTWRAEDAPNLAQRAYLWDVPMTWVGNDDVALWGIGDDDEAMLPGAILQPVEQGQPAPLTVGVPRAEFWSDERHLFVGGDVGLSIWDPHTGERLAELVGFNPIAYNPFTDEFLVKRTYGKTDRIRLIVGKPDS